MVDSTKKSSAVNWIEPLKFLKKKTVRWVGKIEFQDSVVEISSQVFDRNGTRNGASPPPRLAKNIERMVQKAINNHEQDRVAMAPVLVDLYDKSWRKPRARKLSPSSFAKELKLKLILLAQGTTRDQYTVSFTESRERFRGYILKAEVNRGKVTRVSIDSPLDANGDDLLPYLGDMQYPEVPTTKSAQRVAEKVLLTEQTKRFKWAAELSYHAKAKEWYGEIGFQKKRLDVRVECAKNPSPEAWAEERLSQILACVPSAMKEAAHQLTELYNDTWVEDRELSVTAVKRRIKLDSIHLSKKKAWSMGLSDGDLFGGHRIRVDLSSRGKVSCELLG